MDDVIVIGGGIAGCSTAYYLAADGVGVTLLEQFEPGALASGANAGSLHAQIQPEPFLTMGEAWARGFAPALPFYAQSLLLWRGIGTALSVDLEVAQDGGLLVAASVGEMRCIEAKARIEREAGLEMEMLSASDLHTRAPWISDRMVGGAFCPIEGKANPLTAAPAFAAAAVALGARVLPGCRVTAIHRRNACYEVETDKGTLLAVRLVNAAGVEAARVASLVGGVLEMGSFPIQLSVTEPTAPLIDPLLYSASELLTLKQTHSGTVLIGGGWPAFLDGQGRPQVCAKSLLGNLRAALSVVPTLRSLRVVRTWAALVNGNSSWRPLIGEMPGTPGFFVNCVPWLGFSGAPAASRIVASLVQGRSPPVDFDTSFFAP